MCNFDTFWKEMRCIWVSVGVYNNITLFGVGSSIPGHPFNSFPAIIFLVWKYWIRFITFANLITTLLGIDPLYIPKQWIAIWVTDWIKRVKISDYIRLGENN